MIEREVQRRLGAKSTFEQRNNMRAEIIKAAAFRGADDDLRQMTTDDEEVEEEGGRYRRLNQASSATYFGRWGPHAIASRCTGELACTTVRRSSRSNGARGSSRT
jgi:hypothetical protein